MMMGRECRVFRGLAKEVEEDVNKFLQTHPGAPLHLMQSESGEGITITVIVEVPPEGFEAEL